MLSLLLDENLSAEIAVQVTTKRPDVDLISLEDWQEGRYKAQPDEVILTVAGQEGKTLVTYDQKTILPLLVQWGARGRDHAGVVFIDHLTLESSNFGGLVRALIALWDRNHTDDWRNRVDFLRSVAKDQI
jgi:hypothetical protein